MRHSVETKLHLPNGVFFVGANFFVPISFSLFGTVQAAPFS
jgi:hypothetical protein